MDSYTKNRRLGSVKIQLFSLFLGIFGYHAASAQMWSSQDTLYGSEWIDYAKSYYKIPIAEDGFYRISYATLLEKGVPVNEITASQFQLFCLGEEKPLYISGDNPFSEGDYLVFYGEKNRGELDRYLFMDPDREQLNPHYSLFTDTAAYFLTWADVGSSSFRFQNRPQNLSNLPPPETYFMHRAEKVFSDKFAKKYLRFPGYSIFKSNFDIAEGYGSKNSNELLSENQFWQRIDLSLPALYDGGSGGTLQIRFACGPGEHDQALRVNNQMYADFVFENFLLKDTTIELQADALRNNMKIELEGRAGVRDAQTVAYAAIDYPREFDFENKSFFRFSLPASNTDRYLEISNFNVRNGERPVLYDLSRLQRIEAAYEDDKVKILLPPSFQASDLILVNEERGILEAPPPKKISFVNYDEQAGDFIIITHPKLFDDGNGNNWVAEYANYRYSPEGGGFRSLVVDVHQLYDQFAYGLNRHNIAIRNFANYVKRKWTGARYFFIIGKGRDYVDVRSTETLAASEGFNFFVPSFGYPASDNLLFASNENIVPVLPLGRLPAIKGEEVKIYLDKIRAFEANANNPQTVKDRAWMKQILHLGGGKKVGEQQSIRSHLESMQKVIESNTFGAGATAFYKTSTDAIAETVSERIFERINEGVSIITFFGHSSPGTFDFNIDKPENYNNYGKYPYLISLGCYAGDMFVSDRSIGERFVFHQNKGAIAFGASRGLGFIDALGNFGANYYQLLGQDRYGQGIGDALRANLMQYKDVEDTPFKILLHQFNLNGDPSIRLFPSSGPDYVVNSASIRFNPAVVTAQQDSFELNYELFNLGRNQSDTLTVRIVQELPDGRRIELPHTQVAAPAFAQTYAYSVPGQGDASVGLNNFYIDVDPDNEVEEIPSPEAEMNNELIRGSGERGVSLFIIGNNVRLVYPGDFAIVNETQPTLKVSTTNALAPRQKYILEIDTSGLFDSPLKQRKEIIQNGGLIEWSPSIDFQANTVYYWRASPDNTEASVGYIWETSSFTYLPESSPGWSQGRHWQWLEGKKEGIEYDSIGRAFAFEAETVNVRIRNKFSNDNNPPGLFFNFSGAAGSVRPWRFINEGLAVVVSRPRTASFWENKSGEVPFEPGDYGLPTGESRVFAFPTQTQEQRANCMTFLEDVIPEGHYVFVFTIVKDESARLYTSEWSQDTLQLGKDLFGVLENEGAQLARQLAFQDSSAYILMYRKGFGALDEKLSFSLVEGIDAEAYIPRVGVQGRYRSPLIGPAQKWEAVSWKLVESNPESDDQNYYSLYGAKKDSVPELIIDKIQAEDTLINFISADEYPFLVLEFFSSDQTLRTPGQMKNWRVLFEGLPDAAVNPNALLEPQRDTFFQGEQILFKTRVENISDYDMDSLLVQYTLVDPSNEEIKLVKRMRPLRQDGKLELSFALESKQREGKQKLLIDVNPNQDQPELFHFNNTLNWNFYVEREKKNPILDVTFDGLHIMDGDIVSPSPIITILVEDENQYLPLSDTSLLEAALIYPDGSRYNIMENTAQFTFTTETGAGKNQARLTFPAEFQEDGVYQLIVNAKDQSGNIAGNSDYIVRFEVITKKAISNVLNYPNPFSTSTQFVYTLTGEIPSFLKIQILTVAGRVVKEIDLSELGPLSIGTHRSEYVWDGSDDYGAPLANGVYLYRVIAKDENGKDYENYENGTDVYFKKGIGKMVILR